MKCIQLLRILQIPSNSLIIILKIQMQPLVPYLTRYIVVYVECLQFTSVHNDARIYIYTSGKKT